jgi:hypothetical protein
MIGVLVVDSATETNDVDAGLADEAAAEQVLIDDLVRAAVGGDSAARDQLIAEVHPLVLPGHKRGRRAGHPAPRPQPPPRRDLPARRRQRDRSHPSTLHLPNSPACELSRMRQHHLEGCPQCCRQRPALRAGEAGMGFRTGPRCGGGAGKGISAPPPRTLNSLQHLPTLPEGYATEGSVGCTPASKR